MSEKDRYEQLALKWLEGTVTEQEKADFTAWYNTHNDRNSVLPASFASNEHELEKRIYAQIKQSMEAPGAKPAPQRKLTWLFTAAAVLLVGISLGLYWWPQDGGKEQNRVYDVPPGSNRATLMFADGQTVELSGIQEGIVITDDEIRYHDGARLAYPDTETAGSIDWLAIHTPRGGRYQVTLSDGTSVWLNSNSTLRYPQRFLPGKREVEIDGEAYFDVAEDVENPFVVKCKGQEILVLGTEFNINSYADEGGIETTLVSGEVQLKHASSGSEKWVLAPGQQAVVTGAGVQIRDVDVEQFIGWKQGYFYFNEADIYTVMRRFERWYDISVTYEGAPTNRRLMGKIPMNMSLSRVLNVLDAIGVEFEIREDNQLIVKGKKQVD